MAQDVTEKNYLSIVAHYEDCLARHGDTHLGVDWPNREDALKRYLVMNGVFTEKRELSFDEMLNYFKRLVARVFAHARIGVAFNVMSKQVDWERDDLFHLPLDTLAHFLTKELSRNFIIRNDYGLYEYTTYIYK